MKHAIILFALFLTPYITYSRYFKHIGVHDGLAQLSVISINQDELGRMWFGTNEGISVYDGTNIVTYKNIRISNGLHEEMINLSNQVETIVSDSANNLYFRVESALVLYEIRKEQFAYIIKNGVGALAAIDGDIWYAKGDSVFKYKFEQDTHCFISRIPNKSITVIHHSKQGACWIGTTGGLYHMAGDGTQRLVIPDKDISTIYTARNGDVWVGCRTEGLYRVDDTFYLTYYTHQPNNPNSIVSNHIRAFVEDEHGDIWIGTFKGLQRINTYTNSFVTYTQSKLPGGLTHSSIFSLFKDKQGTIWIGTYYGGINYFHSKTDVFHYYADAPESDRGLSYGFVGHMVEDRNNNLWICTEGGGLNMLNRETRKIRHYQSDIKRNSVAHNNLKSICYDKKRNDIYIGTHMGGLSKYNISEDRFTNYLTRELSDAPNDVVHQVSIHDDKLFVLARNGLFSMELNTGKFTPLFAHLTRIRTSGIGFLFDDKGHLWVNITNGLMRIDLKDSDKYEVYFCGENGLGTGYITRIFKSLSGDLFFATRGSGIFRYNEASNDFTAYTMENSGLSSNICYNISQLHDGRLIILTDKGISLFDVNGRKATESVKLGDDGLLITATHENCGIYVTKDGEVFIGGVDGMSSVKEFLLQHTVLPHDIFFSELTISNKIVHPNDQSQVLTEAIPYAKYIILNHKQNNFSIEFASNDYTGLSNAVLYEYILEDFDKHWKTTNNKRIYYTNLSPGEYVLKVREKESDKSYCNEIALSLQIKAPIYATTCAYIIYFLIILTISALFINNWYKRLKLSALLTAEKQSKEQQEILNQSKLRFFTNISHEFKTPLTLITTQAELLLHNSAISPGVYGKILKIFRQAQQLKSLIDELLDFRKFDQQAATITVSELNIVPFLKEIYLTFCEIAQNKEIKYRFVHEADEIYCYFDAKQLRKVINNLLSNAFKYTQKDGEIVVGVRVEEEYISISISDSGIGIDKEDLQRIFERFYQVEKATSEITSGTGIGLALSKSIVDAHEGVLSVESHPGYGSIFCVRLKKSCEHVINNPAITLSDQPLEPAAGTDVPPYIMPDNESIDYSALQIDGDKPTILIVEDNEELKQTLCELFAPIYNVILADNGEEGLKKIDEELPDLVLSDIMMPVMTGTEMCIRIKNKFNTAHIPVVMLTALNSYEHNITGFQYGADDYIAKPFNPRLLLIRCNNILRNRKLVQARFQSEANSPHNVMGTNATDQKIILKIDEVINKHIDDPNFDLNLLARELAVSRSTLFTKIKQITALTPNEYILNYKFKIATQLLIERPELQVGEISDMLGFSSARYFSKCFKAQYAVTPQEYRRKMNRTENY